MPHRFDAMLSQARARLKSIKARLMGLTGVFKTLTEQHGEVIALLHRARTSDDKFRELWPEIKRQLRAHEHAEVRDLYPLLREHEATREYARHHDGEAADLDLLIAQIDELGSGTVEREAAYGRLIEMVRHHAREEENEVFPKAQDAIGRARAAAIDAKLRLTERQLATAF
jgi:hemerythrin superfamily protein